VVEPACIKGTEGFWVRELIGPVRGLTPVLNLSRLRLRFSRVSDSQSLRPSLADFTTVIVTSSGITAQSRSRTQCLSFQ
jgi:hypothetical protein